MNVSMLRIVRKIFGDGRFVSAILTAIGGGAILVYDYMQDGLHHYLVSNTYTEISRTYVVPPPIRGQDGAVASAVAVPRGGKPASAPATLPGSMDAGQQMEAEIKKAFGSARYELPKNLASPAAAASIVTVLVSITGKSGEKLRFSVPAERFYGVAIVGGEADDELGFEEKNTAATIKVGAKNKSKGNIVVMLAIEGMAGEYSLESYRNKTDKLARAGLMATFVVTVLIFSLGALTILMAFLLHRRVSSVQDCNDVQNQQLADLAANLDGSRNKLDEHGNILGKIQELVVKIGLAVSKESSTGAHVAKNVDTDIDRMIKKFGQEPVGEETVTRFSDVAQSQVIINHRVANAKDALGGILGEQ
jgi:hypothetical protein